MGFPNHQIFSQVLPQFDKAMIKPSSPIILGDPTCLKKNRSNRSDGRLNQIYSNIYKYVYLSAQFIIFRRSSLNSNNFIGEIVTSSELINYFTSA